MSQVEYQAIKAAAAKAGDIAPPASTVPLRQVVAGTTLSPKAFWA